MKNSIGPKGNGEETGAGKAIAEGRICGRCKFHFPPGTPIPLLFPTNQNTIISHKQQQAAATYVCVCENKESPHFQVVKGLKGNCDHFESVPQVQEVQIPKSVADRMQGK